MYPLFTSGQSRQIDRLLIEDTPVSGHELMRRAATACCHTILARWPDSSAIIILAGPGNNGGDGYLLGELLLAEQRSVTIYEVTDTPAGNDAAGVRQGYIDAGGSVCPISEYSDTSADLLVDALFGTGLSRPLSARIITLIEKINSSVLPVLSVDIPSGVNADTGQTLPCAVNADVTVTFIVRKQGMYTAQAKDYCGEIVFDKLQTATEHFSSIQPSAHLICEHAIQKPAIRKHNTHKGDYGSVLVVGGESGMAGAVCLAGLAALRCGAGKVFIATRPEHANIAVSVCPALMSGGVSEASELDVLLKKADVVVIGPGLGESAWSRALFSKVLEYDHPKVIDADALVLLSKEKAYSDNWVLTPHPGEARRLLGGQDVQADRYSATREIVTGYGGSCVLKGSGPIVGTKEITRVCAAGNPGMATAGMGDVLSGVIAALIAQGLSVFEAAVSGTCIHALAGDRAAEDGQLGMTATDIIPYLRAEINRAD